MDKNLAAKASVTINVTSITVWNALVNPEAVKQYMSGTNVVSEWKEAQLYVKENGRVNHSRTKV